MPEVRCPVCGKALKSERALKVHLRRAHGSDPSLSTREVVRPRPLGEVLGEVEPEKLEVLTVKGIRLRRGDCVRAVISRNVYIIRIEDFTEVLPVVRGTDIYGNEIAIDLRKAIVLSKMSPEKYEALKVRARELEVKKLKKKPTQKTTESGGAGGAEGNG